MSMKCPSCSSECREGAQFCHECGTPFPRQTAPPILCAPPEEATTSLTMGRSGPRRVLQGKSLLAGERGRVSGAFLLGGGALVAPRALPHSVQIRERLFATLLRQHRCSRSAH